MKYNTNNYIDAYQIIDMFSTFTNNFFGIHICDKVLKKFPVQNTYYVKNMWLTTWLYIKSYIILDFSGLNLYQIRNFQ